MLMTEFTALSICISEINKFIKKSPLSPCRNIWLICSSIPFSKQNKCRGSVVSFQRINLLLFLSPSLTPLSLSLSLSLLLFVCMFFTNDDFMQWMLLTLTLINETVFDDSIMNSYTYFYFHPNI